MSKLASQLAAQEDEEVARAIRTLLATPFLAAEHDEDAFDLVRRRCGRLADWFDQHCGWRLHVDTRQRYARLVKTGDRPDPTRPARRRRSTQAPFDRRRYSLLCIIAAELLATPQTTIGLLASRVTEASAADPELPTFDSTHRDERAAFVDALKLLERYRAIQATDGVTDAFIDQADVKVLFRVDTGRLTWLLAAPTPPSRASAPAELGHEPRYGDAPDPQADVAESQRNLWLRHSITRRLLDDPVVYYEELTEAQRGYISSPTGRRLMRQAAEGAGFALEERAEGLLLVDPDAVATDAKFPEDRNHAKHAALLILDALVARQAPLPMDELVTHVGELLGRFPAWAKTYQSEGGPARLAADAVNVLAAFGLAARTDEGIQARPAAHRYALETEPALTLFGGPA